MLGDIARQRCGQIIAQRQPLVVIILKRKHTLIRAILIRQKFAKRFGILDKRRLHRLEPIELEGCADLLQHTAHGGEFGRPPIPEATRQPRLHLAGGSVLGSIDRRRHRAGLILVKLTHRVLTQSDASGKGA